MAFSISIHVENILKKKRFFDILSFCCLLHQIFVDNRFHYDMLSLNHSCLSWSSLSQHLSRPLTSHAVVVYVRVREVAKYCFFHKSIYFVFVTIAVCYIFLKMPRKRHSEFRQKLSKLMREKNEKKKKENRKGNVKARS